jgi:uncharacterized protein (TIGR02118 family)
MRKLVNLLVRQDGLSHEAFVDYWLNEHAPLAEDLPGVTKYTTSVPADPEKAAYDGIAELYLADDTTVADVFESDAGQRVQADTANFVDDGAGEILVVDETVQFGDD